MCLALVALDSVPGCPLVLAANRDERHDRPAEPMDWWSDAPGILGGRDLRAGGTWLAVRRDGRFATVLNDARVAPPPGAASRGDLVARALGPIAIDRAAVRVHACRERFAGFHLLVGGAGRAWYCSNHDDPPRPLSAGIHAVGNAGLDPGGPRLDRAAGRFRAALDGDLSTETLLDVLSDRAGPGSGTGDDRPIFIEDPDFGTRCSTVLVIDGQGRACMRERRFDASGGLVGERRQDWVVDAGGERA